MCIALVCIDAICSVLVVHTARCKCMSLSTVQQLFHISFACDKNLQMLTAWKHSRAK